MRRPVAAPLPDLAVPDGVTVRGYRPGDDQQLLRVNAAAFADHPEQGAMDAANLAERMAEPWFDPAGLIVAEDPDGSLLGAVAYLPAKFKLRVLDPVHFDVPPDQPRYSKSRIMDESEAIRQQIQEALYDMLKQRQSVWFG